MDRREPVMRGGPMGGGGRHSLPPCAYISNEIHRSLHYGCRNEFIWRSALSEEKKNDWRNALMAVRKLSYTLVLESTPIDCRTRSGKQIVVILRLKKKGRQVIPDNIFFFCAELSEPIGGELEEHHNERLRSRSPPPHHLPPPPPPPPTLSGRNHNELRHFSSAANFTSSPLQTSLHNNRSSSPAHDLGYHTLVSRSPAAPWSSPTDLADLTLTPSPR